MPVYSDDGGMTGGGMEYRELKKDQRSKIRLRITLSSDQRSRAYMGREAGSLSKLPEAEDEEGTAPFTSEAFRV